MFVRLAITYIVAVLFFTWGIAAGRYEVFPFSYIYPIGHDILQYIKGHKEEKTSLVEKLVNDAGIRPTRQLVRYQGSPEREFSILEIDGLRSRRQPPQLYSAFGRQTGGYTFLFGSFDFQDHLHGAILLDENNRVIHRWVLNDAERKRLLDEINRNKRSQLSPEQLKKHRDRSSRTC